MWCWASDARAFDLRLADYGQDFGPESASSVIAVAIFDTPMH
jgi:hypothetical protein